VRVYLDWNATAPPLRASLQAMRAAGDEAWGNPASVHAEGRAARRRVEEARAAVAELAGSDPRDVVFTSSATEANNLAIRAAFGRAGAPRGALVTSRLEHPSVVRVAEALAAEGVEVRWAAVLPDGRVDLDDVKRLLAGARMVALQAVNAETGVVQPVAEVAPLARAAGAWLHVDAVQAFGRAEDVARGADSRSLAGHKLRGPKAIGALITRPGLAVAPLLLGGSQERGVRPGTVDPVTASGLAVAARHAQTSPPAWAALAPRRDRLEDVLLARGALRNVTPGTPRAPHVASLAFPGWNSAELVAALDLEGVAVSGGSACSAGTLEPSPVVTAMHGPARAASTLRIALGETTTDDEITFALAAFAGVLSRSPRADFNERRQSDVAR